MKLPFFSNRGTKPAELGLDFHNHLLPGVDDGSSTLEEAKQSIAALRGAGFCGAVITPHIYKGVYDNTPELLTAAFDEFVANLGEIARDFPLRLAAEYFADESFLDLVRRNDLLFLDVEGERWVLIEFPFQRDNSTSALCVAALAARGYRPVIAHVERYRYVAQGRTVWLSRFARSGAILQGDIGSLAGQHGEDARSFAHWLLSRELIKIWGSDLHKPKQMERHIAPGLAQLTALGRLNAVLNPVEVGMHMAKPTTPAPAAC